MRDDPQMSVVKINAITVPKERFDEFERRFATRAGKVEDAAGFESFELLRPNDDREVCLVVTRWESEEAFQNWMKSADFSAGRHSTGREGPWGPRASCGRSTCWRRRAPRAARRGSAGASGR
jgi:heme oxygenase (mycobilin-producing)